MLIYESRIPGANGGIAASLALAKAGDAGFPVEAAFYAVGALAFTALAAMLLVRTRRGLPALLFALACTLTAGWLGTAAAQFWQHGEPRAAVFALEAASGLAWLVFVSCLLWSVSDTFIRRRRMILASALALFVVGTSIAVVLAYLSGAAAVSDKVFIAF